MRGLRRSVVWVGAFFRAGRRLLAGRVRRLRVRCGEYRRPRGGWWCGGAGIVVGYLAARGVRADRRAHPRIAAAARSRSGDGAADRRAGRRPSRAHRGPWPSARLTFGRSHARHSPDRHPDRRGTDPGRRTRGTSSGIESAPRRGEVVCGTSRTCAMGAELPCRRHRPADPAATAAHLRTRNSRTTRTRLVVPFPRSGFVATLGGHALDHREVE